MIAVRCESGECPELLIGSAAWPREPLPCDWRDDCKRIRRERPAAPMLQGVLKTLGLQTAPRTDYRKLRWLPEEKTKDKQAKI